MTGKSIQKLVFVLALVAGPFSTSGAGELPPSGGKSLSTIIRSVEEKKMGSVSEAEFDDGVWEVKVCNSSACQKLYIAPDTGAEKRRRKTDVDEIPPSNAKPLSVITESIEAGGQGVITEVEFDEGYWKVELLKGSEKIKLKIDPVTGRAVGRDHR